MTEPVQSETRAEVIRLHSEGKGRNEIARIVGVATATVTRIARDEDLSFDRAQTELAVRARSIDLADTRTLLAQKMALAASDMLDQLDGPYLIYNFGGKDNTYEEHLLDSAPVDVIRSAVTTAGIAFDKLTRIVERENGGLEEAVGILDQIADGFRAAAAKYRDEPTDAAG